MNKDKLPLKLREEFGKYAFPDENYGAKAIEPILPFLEIIADVDDNEYRQILIGYNKERTVVAKTQKLSNIRLNLKKAMSPKHLLSNGVPFAAQIPYVTDPFTFFLLLFQFIAWIGDTTIEINQLDAQILYKLYERAMSGLVGREILRKDLEAYVQAEIDLETLNNSLNNLEQLGCIKLTMDKICLTEQIIFVSRGEYDKYFKTS
jgi:hypothetical protein